MLRTSIVLAVVALGLLGYILFVERGTLSEGELERRKGSVLPELIRDRVDKLEIQRKGVTTVLERRRDEEEDLDYWQLTAPLEARADQDAVDALLGELEWMHTRRRFSEISAEDRERFGLEAPRYRVWFSVGKQRVLLRVGKDSPRGDGTYIAVDGRKGAFVVGKDLTETLDHDPGHYYSKALHEGVTRFETRALGLREGEVELQLERGEDGLWRSQQPRRALLGKPAVEALIDAIDGLRASRFESEGVQAAHGLQSPRFELTLRSETLVRQGQDGGTGEPRKTHERWQLRVGAACGEHEGESYVQSDDGPVMCALDADLSKLHKQLDELRERRLLPIEESEITSVELTLGQATQALVDKEGTYHYSLLHDGKQVAQGTAREGAAQDWLQALSGVQAESFTGRAPEFGAGSASLKVGRGKRPGFELRADFGAVEGVMVQRAGEPELVAFPHSALALLQPMAARFKALEVLQRAEDELARVKIVHAGQTQLLARAEQGFDLLEPVEAPADRVVAAELSRMLSGLTALRYVADQALAEHGLQSPRLRLELRFEPAKGSEQGDAAAKPVELAVGAETDGGYFAQRKGDPAVFVLPRALVAKLEAPLVSRSLLSTPLESLRGAKLSTAGGQELALGVEGEKFSLEGASPQDARRLGEKLATLRAQGVVGYGPATPEQGLDKPRLRIAVSLGDAQPGYELLIGAERPDATVNARRSDKAITFAISTADAQALLDFAK